MRENRPKSMGEQKVASLFCSGNNRMGLVTRGRNDEDI